MHVAVLSEQRHAETRRLPPRRLQRSNTRTLRRTSPMGKVAAVLKPCRNAAPQDAVKIPSAYSLQLCHFRPFLSAYTIILAKALFKSNMHCNIA